jgi:hypothetical protein
MQLAEQSENANNSDAQNHSATEEPLCARKAKQAQYNNPNGKEDSSSTVNRDLVHCDSGVPTRTADLLVLHAATSNILVELTGIEPVASWLQTRRSPS